jgi:hypothetical protein
MRRRTGSPRSGFTGTLSRFEFLATDNLTSAVAPMKSGIFPGDAARSLKKRQPDTSNLYAEGSTLMREGFQKAALKAYADAVREFNEFVMHGTVPARFNIPDSKKDR